MLINGVELSSLGIELYDRVLYSNQVDTTQEWLDGDIQPTFIRQQDRFKQIKLDFLVLSANEDEAFKRISKLTALLKDSTIRFDDLNFSFDVHMLNASQPSRLKNGNFIVSYDLTSGYAKGQREIYTTNANMTNSFKLTLAYYKDKTTLISTDTVVIRASSFDDPDVSFDSLGIKVNQYLPKYYNEGVITNFGGADLTYENLLALKVLIINYAPISYNLEVKYYLEGENGLFNEVLKRTLQFTQPGLSNYKTIGQLIDINQYKPEGFSSRTNYEGPLTVEALLLGSPIEVYYDKLQVERTKNIMIVYKKEDDEGGFTTIQNSLITVAEGSIYDGTELKDLINIGAHRPDPKYFNGGYIKDHNADELVSFDKLETGYVVEYTKLNNIIYVEYYAGVYPDWLRLSTATISTKYKESYETDFEVVRDIGIELNKYHTATYEDGALYNRDSYTTYESVINAGVLQVFYKPIEYPIRVNYYDDLTQPPIASDEVKINATMFFNNPVLGDIVPIQKYRPEGYQFSVNLSYSGEVTLEALTQASPIMIVYEEIIASQTKNVIVRYKKELSSAYSTITTNLITVNEADCVGGVRLKDIISLNAFRPEYYEEGILDGASATAIIQYEDIQSSYDVLYMASTYTTPVRYYLDEVNDLHWIGSASIAYRLIDFTADSTLFDFGLDLNAYKPANADNGVLQYNGPINFTALLELASIDVLYETKEAPPDPDAIKYPHRFLFLQHNDLGDYENLHPEWTMNHAFINTGISAEDMSKLTVVMECDRVDKHVPLHEVNANNAYLFGSSSPLGAYYLRFNNQTKYGTDLTGVNLYEAKAGKNTDILTLTEKNAVGFSENSGIYSSPQEGYSRAVFTYSNLLGTEHAQMPYPIYLFANNNNGNYQGGLAGIGIYACRIYYNDLLVRDFIPVSYYDKIGDLVAPSNCLYDKITNSFFEDGTKQNSFNIRDDTRYPDDDLSHKIGHCYVNYYKGEDMFATMAIWFRGDDFANGYDLYEKFFVDNHQPQYTHPGVIENEDQIQVSFDGLNGKVFKVVYEPINTQIEVNYYKDINGENVLLQQEFIPLTEKDFYQAPTFGDIVRLNKYKPEGYETDFVYPGKKVTLARVVENSPYNIIYKPIQEPIVEYTTVLKYIKKVFGVREYETVGTKILTFNQSNFRDGEYIDFYIDFNEYKPVKYYGDGETYHWFPMDERLTVPTDLKPEYEIVYQPVPQYMTINYYTDEVNEANLIATDSWSLKVDDLDPRLTYSLVDILPNEYINKYKPIICADGLIQGADIQHTFDSLMALSEIAIVYETILEPHNPDEAYFEHKVLGFGTFSASAYTATPEGFGGTIPYIDLGYRPKEIGRLKIEVKGFCEGSGLSGPTCLGGFQDYSYNNWFGYAIPRPASELGTETFPTINGNNEIDLGDMYSTINKDYFRGHFGINTYLPVAHGWTYSAEGPQYIDGQGFYRAGDGHGIIAGRPQQRYYANIVAFQRGAYSILDENYEPIRCYKNYQRIMKLEIRNDKGEISVPWIDNPERTVGISAGRIPQLANPITTIMDAYNNYYSAYTNEDSNHSYYELFKNEDKDIFEARLQPQGSLSLFRTTNPLTGEINIMPFRIITAPGATGFPMGLTSKYNPYKGQMGTVEQDIIVQEGVDANNNPIFVHKTQTININYASFPIEVYPQIRAGAIWGIKIWDRDRLVRNLIPVAKGDKIYDYEMPENGLFDLVTEIFFTNNNKGGHYETSHYWGLNGGHLEVTKKTIDISPEEVLPLWVRLDPGFYGKITQNYYDYDYTFINNTFVNVPTWYSRYNTTIEDVLGYNDYKPNEYYLDGLLDLGDDADQPVRHLTLEEIYKMGATNILYKLRTYTKTVVYYQDNYRVGSKDILYSIEDIKNAKTLNDLGIDVDLYYTEDFKHGRIVFDESILANDDIQAFIDAPSPIVIYDKYSLSEKSNILYLEYYRGGAYDENLITIDPNNANYLDCDLTGIVLNPNGAIKYLNHYHSALYEDEQFGYFIPYQAKILNKYTGIHRGPARRYPTLAIIADKDIYTIIEERNGWGRLKEYPVGWILLNAVEPVTGPGQNPDYDVPGDKVATIPFKQEVHITKLTVDRLWCYVPEVESWVKNEDISFNQAGKLYNALNLNVIHLDDIDFTGVDSLDKMGIYPEKYNLYFHERSGYVYDGEYTKEAFSVLHEIDFVYQETVYNYTCIYYKDNVSDGGTIIIDNPGEATTKYQSTFLFKEPVSNTSTGHWIRKVPKGTKITILSAVFSQPNDGTWRKCQVDDDVGYMFDTSLEITKEYSSTEKTYPSNELGRASFSCSLGDWNPDWDKFIETSWKIDASGVGIVPTLYRDTELALPWSYFGFDKNLYQPTGYAEGVYLWNPRSWQPNGDIQFTFRELVRAGTQYVLYPCFQPELYKINILDNVVEEMELSLTTLTTINPGIPIDLGTKTVSAFEDYVLGPDLKTVDINTEVEVVPRTYNAYVGVVDIPESRVSRLSSYIVYERNLKYPSRPGFTVQMNESDGLFDFKNSLILNISNLRESPTNVIGIAQPYEGKPYQFYLHNPNGTIEDKTEFIGIHDNTNLRGYNYLQETDFKTPNTYLKNTKLSFKGMVAQGCVYGIQMYEAFMMKHWWVPVPKGLWYKFNGETLRIPDNGLFDILTGQFSRGYDRRFTGPLNTYTDSFGTEHSYTQVDDGKSLVYLRNDAITDDNEFNYFDDWHFNVEDVDYIVKAPASVKAFEKPDIYATKINTLASGLVLPVSGKTNDTQNNVVGEWYRSCGQWFRSKDVNIHAGDFDKSKLTKLQQNITLVAPVDGKEVYYVYLDPSTATPGAPSEASYAPATVMTVYYNYVDKQQNKYYFDGSFWVPEEYTSFNTKEWNKNYAVVPDRLAYYSQPILDDSFIQDYYHYGERITIPYVCVKDPEWGYTGLGWIRVNPGNVSEIIK